ncbi:transcription factor, MADS-box [Elaphomyces granulatus]
MAANKARKSITQKRYRRREGLERKVYEYSKMCDADIYLGIRIRENGRLYTFSADTSGFWAFLKPIFDSYYPTPMQKTDKDLESAKQGDMR